MEHVEQLEGLIREMMLVAAGSSAHELRAMVQRLMPNTKLDAEQFVAFIKRLRLAAEAMESTATEAYTVVLRRAQ